VQLQRAVRQTRHVLQAAQRAAVRRLIYTSTLTTIGPVPAGEDRLADERDLYTPGLLGRSAYYECKYAMESEVLRSANDLPAVVVNPTAVFGPGDLHLALGRVLLALARGWGLAWIPAVTNVVDVRDVAQAQVRAAEAGQVGQRYILGGHNLPVRELMMRAASILGVPPPRWGLPLGVIDAAVWLGDRLPLLDVLGNHLRAVRQWQGYDCGKAVAQLGLQNRSVEETLRAAVAWYADNGYLTVRPAVV
jgi:dihydroflavonol-4-reductase